MRGSDWLAGLSCFFMVASTSFTVLTPFRQANPCSLGPWAPCPCPNLVRGTWRAACIASANFVTVWGPSLSSRGGLAARPPASLCTLCVSVCACACASRSHVMCRIQTRSRASSQAEVRTLQSTSTVIVIHDIAQYHALSKYRMSMLFATGAWLGGGGFLGWPGWSSWCTVRYCAEATSVDGLTIDD